MDLDSWASVQHIQGRSSQVSCYQIKFITFSVLLMITVRPPSLAPQIMICLLPAKHLENRAIAHKAYLNAEISTALKSGTEQQVKPDGPVYHHVSNFYQSRQIYQQAGRHPFQQQRVSTAGHKHWLGNWVWWRQIRHVSLSPVSTSQFDHTYSLKNSRQHAVKRMQILCRGFSFPFER